jgi:hypothetical protein
MTSFNVADWQSVDLTYRNSVGSTSIEARVVQSVSIGRLAEGGTAESFRYNRDRLDKR